MPTQNAEYAVGVLAIADTVGTIHDPLTEVTEPDAPVIAYPAQLVLDEVKSVCILGPIDIWGVAASAGLIADKITMMLNRIAIGIFICFIFFVLPFNFNREEQLFSFITLLPVGVRL
jgi:hypothetical protein